MALRSSARYGSMGEFACRQSQPVRIGAGAVDCEAHTLWIVGGSLTFAIVLTSSICVNGTRVRRRS